MSHPYLILAQQRAEAPLPAPPARVGGIQDGVNEVVGLAIMASPLIAAMGVYAYGRSQKRSNLASGTAGALAGAGTFLGVATAFMGARPGEALAVGAAVTVPSIAIPMLVLKKR